MIGLKWFFVSGILLAAAKDITIINEEDLSSSVQSALETVLGFNRSDRTENINFLSKVQTVIGNMKNVFENKSNVRRSLSDIKLEKFTDFIQIVIKKLTKYNNIDLEHFFAVLNDEVRKYHYQGCKFHELTENYAFRTFLSGLFNEIKIQPGNIIKMKLKSISTKIKIEKYNRIEKDLIDVINSLYRQDATEKFRPILLNIDVYRLKSRKNIDLVYIIREGLRTVIFDHYSHLNQNARKALQIAVNDYWNYLSQQLPFQDVDDVKIYKAEDIEESTELTTKEILITKDREPDTNKDQVTGNRFTNKSSYLSFSVRVSKSNKIHDKKFKNVESQSNTQRIKPKAIVVYRQNYKPNKKIDQSINLPSRTTKCFRPTKYSLKYETDAYEYLTRDVRRKKITFKALYPEFGSHFSWSGSLGARRKFSHGTPMNSIKYWSEKYGDSVTTIKPKRLKAIRLVNNLKATFAVGMKTSHLPRIYKGFNEIKRLKTSKEQLRKPIRNWVATEASSEKLIRPKNNLKASNRKRWYFQLADKSGKSYGTKTKDSMVSLESSSLDDLVKPKISYRRNNNGTLNYFQNTSNDSLQFKNLGNMRKDINNGQMIQKTTNSIKVKDDNKFINSNEKIYFNTINEANENIMTHSPYKNQNKSKLKMRNLSANQPRMITVNEDNTQNQHNETHSTELSQTTQYLSNLSRTGSTIDATKSDRDVIRGQNNEIIENKNETDWNTGDVNKPPRNSEQVYTYENIEHNSKLSSNTSTTNIKHINGIKRLLNSQVTYNDIPADAYVNVYENFDELTLKQTTLSKSKLIVQNLIRKGAIEDSQESLKEKEFLNSTGKNVQPLQNYDNNEERFNRISEQYDLVAEEFPEFGAAWTGDVN